MISSERSSHLLESADVLAHLSRTLSSPPNAIGIKELADIWQVECLRLECDLPDDLEDHPELSLRVRGAFGRQLHALPPGSTRTGFQRPRAWDVLAAPLGYLPQGDEVPKPLVLRAGMSERALVVEMRVLGTAVAWFDDAASALLKALEGGVALRSVDRGLRVPIRVRDMYEERISGVPLPMSPTTATLRLRSPLVVRHKQRFVEDSRSILRAIVRRVASLARWHCVTLSMPSSEIERAIGSLDLDDRDLVPFRWQRFSMRQGNIPIPAAGWLGILRVNGPLSLLAPYLALGETMNAGAQASLGLGWYELAMA